MALDLNLLPEGFLVLEKLIGDGGSNDGQVF